MNNPCEMRPSNGRACARKFGREFAQERHRVPTYAEVTAHTTDKWSSQWRGVLYDEAIQAAGFWLGWNSQESLTHKAHVEETIKRILPVFDPLNVTLHVTESNRVRGNWVIIARFLIPGTHWHHSVYAGSVESLLCKLAAHKDWAEHCSTLSRKNEAA